LNESSKSLEEEAGRLEQQLKKSDLQLVDYGGGGECLFLCLSHLLWNSPAHTYKLRKMLVCQMRSQWERLEGFVTGDFEKYCNEMEKYGTWGGHIELSMASELFSLNILVFQVDQAKTLIITPPSGKPANSQIGLAHLAGSLQGCCCPSE